MTEDSWDFKPVLTCSPSCFEENWKEFAEYHPDVAEKISHAYAFTPGDEIFDYHLIADSHVNREISYCEYENGVLLQELDGLSFASIIDADLLREIRTSVTADKMESCRILISIGLLPAQLALKAHPHLSEFIIIVVEPDMYLFLCQLAIHDFRDLLSFTNTSCIVGEGYVTEFSQLFDHEALCLIDREEWTIVSGSHNEQGEGSVRDAVNQLHEESAQDCEAILAKIEAVRSQTAPIIRWDAGTRLWMCGISRGNDLFSIHLEILRSLADAYEKEGLEVTFAHEHPYREAVRLRLQHCFAECSPEAVLFLNAYPGPFLDWIFRSPDAHDCFRFPRLVWLTDDIRYSPGYETGFSEYDILFCVDKTYVEQAKAMGAKHAFYLPAATSINRQGKQEQEHAHPIVFVGSVTDLRAELSNLRPGAKEWLQKAVADTIQYRPIDTRDSLDAKDRANLLAVVDSICIHMNKRYLEGDKALSYALYVLANTYKRITLIKQLIPMGLVAYGNADWENLLDEHERQAYLGPIAYEDLPDLYASAKISLNIHSLQCPTCLNPRDFDVLMSGGFLLSDWVLDVDQGLLLDNKEAIFYRSTPHLKDLVAYYLINEKARLEIAAAGNRRVARDHRYINRAGDSLGLLREFVT
ncbi:MAG: glycosyltransferase [bacterium]